MNKKTDKQKVKKRVKIREEFCKECGICMFYCPDGALKFQNEFNARGFHPAKWSGNCSFCGRCYIVCPHLAIEIEESDCDE